MGKCPQEVQKLALQNPRKAQAFQGVTEGGVKRIKWNLMVNYIRLPDLFLLSPPPGRRLEDSSLENLSYPRGRSFPFATGATNREHHRLTSPMSQRQNSPSACSASVSVKAQPKVTRHISKSSWQERGQEFSSGRWEDAHSDFSSTVSSSERLPLATMSKTKQNLPLLSTPHSA